jgi:hypothetical protein
MNTMSSTLPVPPAAVSLNSVRAYPPHPTPTPNTPVFAQMTLTVWIIDHFPFQPTSSGAVTATTGAVAETLEDAELKSIRDHLRKCRESRNATKRELASAAMALGKVGTPKKNRKSLHPQKERNAG